jgi:hypothetical protein
MLNWPDKSLLSIKIILVFICISFASQQKIAAQQVPDVLLNERFMNRPLNEFLDILRLKYDLRVFFRPEWTDTISINREFNNTPLYQALHNIFQETDLTFEFMQHDGIIIFPATRGNQVQKFEEAQFLVIGDPLNSGRYKSASLKGKVVDGKTGEPLPGAVVYQNQDQKGTSTNREGYFEIVLPTGDHQIQLSFMGFQEAHWKIRLIEDGYETFELFEESHVIGEVTVMGKEAGVARTQMGMVQMSPAEIKKLPALMGEVDVLKSMSRMPGVQVVGELSSGFNVRGGNTDQNLILVSGSPVFNTSHLFGFLSVINPDIVQDVRLYKGGLPARFGERVSSVMQVSLKDGNEEQLRYYGGIGLINSRLTVDGPLTGNRKLTVVAGGRSSYTNWILHQVPELDLARSVTSFYDVSGKLTWKFNPQNRVSLTAYVSDDEFSTSAQSVTRYGNILGSLLVNHQLVADMNGELELSHSEYAYRLTDYADRNPLNSYHLDNHLSYSSAGYALRWHFHPRHNLGAGIKGIKYTVSPGRVSPVEQETSIEFNMLNPENATEWAGFIDDEITLSPKFTVSAGIRYSRFENRGPALVYIYDENKPVISENVIDSIRFGKNEVSKSYGGPELRIAARYDLKPSTLVKVNYQRVRQYMFQLSNNAVISPAETWKPAGYHLKPLISDQFAAGIENKSWLKDIELTAELYFKTLQNLVEYRNGAQLIMNEYIETSLLPSDGYSYGIELGFKKDIGRLTGYAGYVYSRTMQKTTSGFEDDNFRSGGYYPSLYDKPHDLSLVGTYNISRRWRVTGNFVFISGRPVTLPELKYEFNGETLIWYSERNKYRMPPYHRMDIAVTFDENLRVKRMWKGSWTLSVYNLYGRENPYSIYYRKSEQGFRHSASRYSLYKLSVIGVPVPSLTYNFRF